MGQICLDFQLMIPKSFEPISVLRRNVKYSTFAAIPVMLKEKVTDKGMVLIKDLTVGPNENDTNLIKAHKNKIQKMEFSHDLQFIAIAAQKSSTIRIFKVKD